MKIIKHTFRIPKLEVVDGDLIENGYDEETYTFTLLHKGFGIFEELTGKPLMAYLAGMDAENLDKNIDKLMSKDFIPNLACASYVKVEDNKFHNNRATAEEFRKLPVFNRVAEDIEFGIDIIQMAMDCMLEDKKAENKSKEAAKPKK